MQLKYLENVEVEDTLHAGIFLTNLIIYVLKSLLSKMSSFLNLLCTLWCLDLRF